jgi:hypothetical protein
VRKRFIVRALLFGLVPNLTLMRQEPSPAIQADRPTAEVSPMLYGLMAEEIKVRYVDLQLIAAAPIKTMKPGVLAVSD